MAPTMQNPSKKITVFDLHFIIHIFFVMFQSRRNINNLPLKKIVAKISKPNLPSNYTSNNKDSHYIAKTVRYIKGLSRRAPFKSNCYDRALTLKYFLNKKEIPSALCLGVATSAEIDLEAHAWIEHQGKVIIGDDVSDNFTPVQKII